MLGASVASVVILLSRSIGIRLIIAFIIATPLGWLVINWRLSDYTYKVDIGPELFLMVGAISLFGKCMAYGVLPVDTCGASLRILLRL